LPDHDVAAIGYPVVTITARRNILSLRVQRRTRVEKDARWRVRGNTMTTTALFSQPKLAARTILAGTVLALTVSLNGCSRSEALPKSVVQSFEQAFNADNIEGCLALFDEEAQILPERGPAVSGREGIAEYLKNQMTPVVSFNTEADMTMIRNDIAIEQGHFRVRDVRRGSDIEEGKYLHVWRNRGQGWKLYRVMYNTDYAPETEVEVAQAANSDDTA
jgi:ketosteroid isomerase-like protein